MESLEWVPELMAEVTVLALMPLETIVLAERLQALEVHMTAFLTT